MPKEEMLKKKLIVATKLPKFKGTKKNEMKKKICGNQVAEKKKNKKKTNKAKRVVLYSSTLTLMDPCTAFLKKAGKVNKIHYNNFFFVWES